MNQRIINEGLIQINIPEFEKVSSEAPVFYNPVMELNRDLSVLALNTFQKELNKNIDICDAFGGSGIRGIRYSKEVNDVSRVLVNDIDSTSIEFIKINAELNDVNIEISQNDANMVLRENRGKFDVVDIDPFGTPSQFIDSVGYNLKKNSLLCVTATDTSALCGTYPHSCMRKYNAKSYRSEYCHETGIRILIGFVALTLAKYKKYLKIMFSHSSEHYMRAYINVRKGSAKTDESLKNMGFIAHCSKCLFRTYKNGLYPAINERCPNCGEKINLAGPLWLDKIQNEEFIGEMINFADEIELNRKNEAIDLLNKCLNEADAEITFYEVHKICKLLKISAPKLEDIMNSLKKEGFNVVRTHYNPLGIKTNADINEIKDIIMNI